MSSHLGKFQQNLKQIKPRTFILLVGAVAILIFIIAMVGRKNTASIDENAGNSRSAQIPNQVTPESGGEANDEYYDLVYSGNQNRFNQAIANNNSAVPTLVHDQLLGDRSSVSPLNQAGQGGVNPNEEYQRRLAERQAQALREAEQRRLAAISAEDQARQEAFGELMAAQAITLISGWAPPPAQRYVAGSATFQNPNNDERIGDGNRSEEGAVLYKAGDILFAVLETAVNTDEGGPVMARIVSGPLAGARVLGGLQDTTQYAKKVILQFNILNIPGMPNSQGFSAVSIDPDTARTAIASNVNNHYFLRYSTLLASSFLEGMGDVVQSAYGRSNTGGGLINIDFSPQELRPTPRDQLIAGFGNVGRQVGRNINLFNRPPTITIDSGVPMGLLLMEDLRLEVPGETDVSVMDATAIAPGIQTPPAFAENMTQEVADFSSDPLYDAYVGEISEAQQREQFNNQLNLLMNMNNEVGFTDGQ